MQINRKIITIIIIIIIIEKKIGINSMPGEKKIGEKYWSGKRKPGKYFVWEKFCHLEKV